MYEKLELLIDGEWRPGSDGKTEPVINPATEETIADLPHASAQDLDHALAAAEKAFPIWRDTAPYDRGKIMQKAAALMRERSKQIAETLVLEEGKVFAEAHVEVLVSADITDWYAEEGKRTYGRIIPGRIPGMRQFVYKEPVGPVAAFTPWNFPAVTPIRKMAGAIAAGCSCIIKASEETPGTCIALARAFQDAGLPNGVLNVVFGVPAEVSKHVIASPIIRKISFTGSIAVGKLLMAQAAEGLKRTTMELGGHSPVIVFDDTDVEQVVKAVVGGKYRNAGQVCISPTRFYVQDAHYAKFVKSFTETAKAMKVGNGMEEGMQMGPLANPRRLEAMQEFVADARDHGAKIETGGERMGNNGFFFEPTVMSDVPDDARVMYDEPFGPLAPISRFKDFDEVMEKANGLEYGLAAYAFTTSDKTAAAVSEKLQSGMVGVNSLAISMPETPFGGVKHSGHGSEGGIEGLEAYLNTKYVAQQS